MNITSTAVVAGARSGIGLESAPPAVPEALIAIGGTEVERNRHRDNSPMHAEIEVGESLFIAGRQGNDAAVGLARH
jgi:hypothetical protein